jgi:hypothetical protein
VGSSNRATPATAFEVGKESSNRPLLVIELGVVLHPDLSPFDRWQYDVDTADLSQPFQRFGRRVLFDLGHLRQQTIQATIQSGYRSSTWQPIQRVGRE